MEIIRLLHIGIGAKARQMPGAINLDNSAYAHLKSSPFLRRIVPMFLSPERRKRYLAFPDGVVVHDIRKTLPFASHSIAAVYHSHVLEHLDRDDAERFVRDVARVLVPGGIHRIAVPDLEQKCQAYLHHLAASLIDEGRATRHERFISSIIEQSVRRESATLAGQHGWRRWVESWLLGDARARGETHQWMYDRVTLGQLLTRTDHVTPKVRPHGDSDIEDWESFNFEIAADGLRHRPASLIMEARTRD